MYFSIGQRVRVKQDYHIPFYRGRVYTIEGNPSGKIIRTTGIAEGSYHECPLEFWHSNLEPVETNGRCIYCDAITPERTVCCECKVMKDSGI